MKIYHRSRKFAIVMFALIFLNSVIILELGKTLIYKTEIVAKGKAGAEKFKQVYEGFWDKLEELLEKEKSIDRKWIPDFAEEIGEEVLTEVLKEARKTFDLKVILQQIFDEEKAGNKNIL